MAYCFICGDLCDTVLMKSVPGIKVEMVTKAGWLPSRIPKRLAGPNPRNWWQDTVHQSISSNWSLCGPCSAEFEAAKGGGISAPAPVIERPEPTQSAPLPQSPPPSVAAPPRAAGGAKIALPLDTSIKPSPEKIPNSPALKALKRNQLIALSPGSLGIMVGIVMFATTEDGVPFSFLLVPISLIAIAVLAILVLEGRKVQIIRDALEEQLWGSFLQNTFQAWRGGLLDQLAAWYRSAPSNYQGFQDFIEHNIEVKAFRKLGLWFRPEPDEFLIEVDGRTKSKPAFLLTNRRGIILSIEDGYVAFPWAGLRKVSTATKPQGMELSLTGSEGEQTIALVRAPTDKALDFLVKKQGIPLSGARIVAETVPVVRSVESVVANAATATVQDMEWLATQGDDAFAAIQALSDRVRAGEWTSGEALGKLCIPLGDLGTEAARKLLTILLQLPDPTREAELVREGSARGLERLRARG